ncbi:MAG TPA: dihydropteroate synthase [Saprospiraceae bacterium]|nr:dihydropteroate synthase [Saprospiraceae bacterium]
MTINCAGKLLDLSEPRVMGIINVTSDSFYRGSRKMEPAAIRDTAIKMIEQGAALIDLGAMSSRPGAELVDPEKEWQVLSPALEAISDLPGILISVDTVWSLTARRSIEAGAHIINDISGGAIDPEMMAVVASFHHVPYILMHMKGLPSTMNTMTQYHQLVPDLLIYFAQGIRQAREAGIKDLIIDPGFGFAKTKEQSFYILNHLSSFHIFDLPIFAGLSRKSMLYKSLNITAEEALNATTAANMAALMGGASLLRVHDVAEAVQTVKIFQQLKTC